MANNKKISISALEKIMKENKSQPVTVEWNGIEIVIKPTLSLKEILTFVDDVVKSCFIGDTGEYHPELKPFFIKSNVLEAFANFKLPPNASRRYDIIYNTDAFDVVLQYIDTEQFNEIVQAIDSKIDSEIQLNTRLIQAQIHEAYLKMDELQKEVSSLFEGINAEDISNFIGGITEGGFDEEQLVKAYINQTNQSNDTMEE